MNDETKLASNDQAAADPVAVANAAADRAETAAKAAQASADRAEAAAASIGAPAVPAIPPRFNTTDVVLVTAGEHEGKSGRVLKADGDSITVDIGNAGGEVVGEPIVVDADDLKRLGGV